MMKPRVAVLASEGLLLDSLLDEWQGSERFRECEPLLLCVGEAAGQSAMFGNKALAFQSLEQADLSALALLIVLESSLVVEASRNVLSQLSCPVIGSRQSLQSLNPAMFDGSKALGVLAVPQAPTIAVQLLSRHFVLESVDATMLLPASLFGKQGVEELAMQTARLLNAQTVEKHLFEQQMPFNCFPLADDIDAFQQQLTAEWQEMFSGADAHLSAVQVPVFHGMGMQLALVLDTPIDIPAVTKHWQAENGLNWLIDSRQLSMISAAQDEGMISLGSVRQSPVDEYRIDLWLAFDDMRLYMRHGLLAAADFLLKSDL